MGASDVPEFFCNDVERLELAAPGVVRLVLFANGREPGEHIERVSVLFPMANIPSALARVAAFVASKGARDAGAASAVLM